MSRYHFHVYDGDTHPDHAGTDLPDVLAARKECSRLAGALLQQSHEAFWGEDDWRMEITDDKVLLLLRLDIVGTHSPAVLKLVRPEDQQ